MMYSMDFKYFRLRTQLSQDINHADKSNNSQEFNLSRYHSILLTGPRTPKMTCILKES